MGIIETKSQIINFFFKNTSIKWYILIIIVFLLIQYLIKRYKNNCDSTQNRYYQDIDEILPGINYYLYKPNQIRYIFWTGGYDSTFLLIQALIIEGYPVQPIYIKCQNLDTKYSIDGRKNQSQELNTMKKIRKVILDKYPYTKQSFLPTMYVYNIQKDKDITYRYKMVHQKYKFFSRDITQYERMARFSIHFNKNIEVGLEKCGTGLDEATQKVRINEGSMNCRILDKKDLNNIGYKYLDIFRNLRFPIVHLSKNDMKIIASEQKLYYILELTWSCWYPNKDGTPCGICYQCRERTI